MNQQQLVDAQTERHVLAAILHYGCFDKEQAYKSFMTLQNLPNEVFGTLIFRWVFKAIGGLVEARSDINIETVYYWLLKKNPPIFQGPEQIRTVIVNISIDTFFYPQTVKSSVPILLEFYRRRRYVALGADIEDQGQDLSIELDEAIRQVEQEIQDLLRLSGVVELPTAADGISEIFDRIENGRPPTTSTGLYDLDENLNGGLSKTDLIILAARASMGKTWTGCHLARQAIDQGKAVVFFSAEMSKPQLVDRMVALYSGIDSKRIATGKVTSEESMKLLEVFEDNPLDRFFIDDSPAASMNQGTMSRFIQSVKQKLALEGIDLGLVILDYIQKLGDRANENRNSTVGKLAGACKDMAKQFDVPFVALAQINRAAESAHNKRPAMAQIKESGDIEQDADVILLLYRDEYYNPNTSDRGVMEINIAKNRNGATGSIKTLFDPTTGVFRNMQKSNPRAA